MVVASEDEYSSVESGRTSETPSEAEEVGEYEYEEEYAPGEIPIIEFGEFVRKTEAWYKVLSGEVPLASIVEVFVHKRVPRPPMPRKEIKEKKRTRKTSKKTKASKKSKSKTSSKSSKKKTRTKSKKSK